MKQWLTENWKIIVTVLIVLVIIFFNKFRKKPKVEKEITPKEFSRVMYPENGFSLMTSLYTQKKAIEKELNSIGEENKSIFGELQQLTKQNFEWSTYMNNRKRLLQQRYNQYAYQYNLVNNMINNQKKIETS